MSSVHLTIFLLLAALSLHGQHVIRGVVNGPDGVIPGATVRLTGEKEQGVVTDTQGSFELISNQDIAKLEVRSIGYRSVTRTIQLPLKNQILIQLEESTLGLNEVVITGTLSPTFVSKSPIKTEVLTTKYFNTFKPSGSNNLVDAMQMINGVQEVIACGVCFTNSISINGLPGQYSAVLVDGMPMYGNLASIYGLNSIPGIMIDRIEVVKGPGSTLYGSEAVAGVINIITRDPNKQPGFTIDMTGTSHGESFLNLAGSKTWDHISMYSGINYSGMQQYIDENGDNFGDIINMDRLSLFSKWMVNLSGQSKLTASLKLMHEDRRNGTQQFMTNPEKFRGSDSVYGESIVTNRMQLFGSYNSSNDISIDYSLSLHDQASMYGTDDYNASQQIAFINTYKSYSSGTHKLLPGITLRYQYYNDNTFATSGGGDHQFIPGIFLQDEWSKSDKFTLLSGIRADYYNDHGVIFSPRLSVKWKAGPWTNVRLNSGTGFRIVNLFTEDHAFITGQRSVEISEDILPERSVNAALNVNHILTVGSSQAVLDLDLFYTYFMNKIIPDYSQANKIIYANTDGHATTRGVSVNWSQEFSFPLELTAGLTWMKATETSVSEVNNRLPYAPEWSGLVNVSYKFRKPDLLIAWSANLTGTMLLPEVYDLDETGIPLNQPRATFSKPFQLHNIQLTKNWRNWRIYGGISNIFNYVQSDSPLSGLNDPNNPPGFSPYFDTAYSYAPLHGRELFLGVSWSLKN